MFFFFFFSKLKPLKLVETFSRAESNGFPLFPPKKLSTLCRGVGTAPIRAERPEATWSASSTPRRARWSWRDCPPRPSTRLAVGRIRIRGGGRDQLSSPIYAFSEYFIYDVHDFPLVSFKGNASLLDIFSFSLSCLS